MVRAPTTAAATHRRFNIASSCDRVSARAGLLLEHDLFRKPVSTLRDHALDLASDLLFAQRTPDVRAPVDEGFEVHDILDAFVLVPLLGDTHRAHVDDLLDAPGATGH